MMRSRPGVGDPADESLRFFQGWTVRSALAPVLSLCVAIALAPPVWAQVSVLATVETDPVPSGGDAADDAAFWVHPADASLSTIIGTDKQSGLGVYDMDGNRLQFLPDGNMNNVDIRYGFPLSGASVDLVGATNRTNDTIAFYTVDPGTRHLSRSGSVPTGLAVYGFCMYRSPATGKYYAFVDSSSGEVEEYELSDGGGGQVRGTLVRTFDVGAIVEGCVADDEHAAFYIGEEDVAIWRYGAEPGSGTGRVRVDSAGGHFAADVEGLTIYYASDGTGYLIASSQGNSRYVLYRREDGNGYVAEFRIVDGAIDGVTGADGIDVMNVPMGGNFPSGAFITQDDSNPGGNQNYKLVPWESIANAVTPPLTIDPRRNPRSGAGGGVNHPPVVDAGPDQSVTLPAAATLDGTVTDDGLPDPPGAMTTAWSKVSGPGTVTFAAASAVDTTAAFSASGTYVLRLTADDGELQAGDTVTVTVGGGGANQPPAVDAGPDQTVTLPAAATLDGTVTDDGLPDPPGAMTTAWSLVSGPGTVTFADPSAVDTTAGFSGTGSYILRLTADDGEYAVSSTVTCTVDGPGGGGAGGNGGGCSLASDNRPGDSPSGTWILMQLPVVVVGLRRKVLVAKIATRVRGAGFSWLMPGGRTVPAGGCGCRAQG